MTSNRRVRPGQDRITGVRIADRQSGAEEVLGADLVVDAMSRGSRTPAFLERLAAHVMAALKAGQPIGDVARHHTPSNRWRRYDKLRRLAGGLLVVGDAICSFNPIYGQGMTVAAMDALVLRDCLRRGGRDLSRRFSASAANGIDIAWQMAVSADLALPEVEATRSLSVRLPNAYVDWRLSAAETDRFVAEQFWKVLIPVERPSHLLHPAVVACVAIANLPCFGARVPNTATKIPTRQQERP